MEDRIREAYEQMSPTPEQEERMLAALQKAQQEMPGQERKADDFPSSVAVDSEASSFEARPAPEKKRGSTRAWKVIVPLAACLAVGAVVVGAGSLFGSNTASSPSSSVAEVTAVSNAEERTAESKNAGVAEKEAYTAHDSAAEGVVMMGAMGVEEVDSEAIPTGEFNTEEYAAVDENGFISTKTQPLSTVSADVDTASYANLRRMINSGMSLEDVPSGAVRIEEMLNYFTYNYDEPTGDDLFGMQAQAAPCPWNADTQLLTIGFATRSEERTALKGSNLVFLIDVSGSMDSQDKLELLQDSFATLLENLNGNDRVSIVTYSGAEEIVLEGAAGDDEGEILRAIYKLRADGSTNGEAGLKMAYEVAERNYIEGGVNRIVMASDGDLNVGATSESDLYDLVDGKRETGIYLSVLGFGTGNYKDTKMEVLADHGNGSYHYIDSIEEANRVLSERLTANLVPFADDVKVQVEFNPAQVKGYRLIGYENREMAAEDFLNDTVDAGDVGPNTQFTVAYEVVLADSPYEINVPELKYGDEGAASPASEGSGSDWLTCSLRYRAFADDGIHEQELVVSADNETANPSDDWKFAAAVMEFGMVASDSAYRGDLSCDSVLALLEGQKLSGEREGFRDLVEKAKRQSGDSPRNDLE